MGRSAARDGDVRVSVGLVVRAGMQVLGRADVSGWLLLHLA
jgi:hypothetical protein